MNNFEDINIDIVWRREQLLMAKTLPYIHQYSETHKHFLIKHSIPMIYSIWEGFVQNAFQIYIRELNSLGLKKSEFCERIVAHAVDNRFPQLQSYPLDFAGRLKFIVKLDTFLESEFKVGQIVRTESNVQLEVLNRLMQRFNLEELPAYPHKQKLKDLLFFRNRIAHGDISVVISEETINDFMLKIDVFVAAIEVLMTETYDRILSGYNIKKSHLRELFETESVGGQ